MSEASRIELESRNKKTKEKCLRCLEMHSDCGRIGRCLAWASEAPWAGSPGLKMRYGKAKFLSDE